MGELANCNNLISSSQGTHSSGEARESQGSPEESTFSLSEQAAVQTLLTSTRKSIKPFSNMEGYQGYASGGEEAKLEKQTVPSLITFLLFLHTTTKKPAKSMPTEIREKTQTLPKYLRLHHTFLRSCKHTAMVMAFWTSCQESIPTTPAS